MTDPDRDLRPPRHRTARRTRAPLRPRILKLVRRIHLHAGLFLMPFVLAYSISGYIMNHPSQFASLPSRTFGRAKLLGTSFAEGPRAAALAAQVVESLRAPGDGGRRILELVEPESARFSRSVEFTARHGGRSYTLRIYPERGYGRLTERRTRPRAPFARRLGLALPESVVDRWREDASLVAERLGLVGARLELRRAPQVRFRLRVDGEVWLASYDLLKGSLSGRSTETPSRELSFGSLLRRLHGARGYPSDGGVRWFWALQVDAVAIMMMLWSISGLLMWSQQRRLRAFGAMAILGGSATAAVLIAGMHYVFTH